MGLPPHTPLGDFIPKPHLRFAAVLSGLAESGFASLPDSCLFESLRDWGNEGLLWGCHPMPRLGISSPNPISATRRFKAA